VELYGEDACVRIANNALGAYLTFHERNPPPDPSILDRIRAHLATRPLSASPGDAGGTFEVTRDEIFRKSMLDLNDFFQSRHSIRNFDAAPVPMATIQKAVELALRTPSVCNRQSWRVRVLSTPPQKEAALGLQNGNKGFDHTIDKVLVVSVSLETFVSVGERNQGWIDGGMFSMSLIWALHSLGIGSCALNWSAEMERDRSLHQALNIPDQERVIMMIAVGNLPEKLHVACSARIAAERVLRPSTAS